MAVILDQASAYLLDQTGQVSILDQAGAPNSSFSGSVASVAVTAYPGTVFGQTGTSVDTRISMEFRAYTSVTAQATMEFEAGQPVQAGLTTLAEDPWTSMYPG
jgi:hypothetical protein